MDRRSKWRCFGMISLWFRIQYFRCFFDFHLPLKPNCDPFLGRFLAFVPNCLSKKERYNSCRRNTPERWLGLWWQVILELVSTSCFQKKLNYYQDSLARFETKLRHLCHHIHNDGNMIYTEEGRDRLDDPLATNFKSVSWRVGKPVPIPDSAQWWVGRI